MKFIKNLLKEKTGKINSSLTGSAINNAPLHKPRRTMIALEPRIMFDGAAVATADASLPDTALTHDNGASAKDVLVQPPNTVSLKTPKP